MARDGTSLIWSPRSNISLYGFTADAVMHEQLGVNIALGTDSPQIFSVPGFAMHHEMALYVEVGMSPYDVLEIATRKPAEYFGAADTFGTVEVGKQADLILLTANPLDDIANASRRAGVMLGGRWYAEAEIQRRLDDFGEKVLALYAAGGSLVFEVERLISIRTLPDLRHHLRQDSHQLVFGESALPHDSLCSLRELRMAENRPNRPTTTLRQRDVLHVVRRVRQTMSQR